MVLRDFMTVQEAAAALGVTPRRVQQLVSRGELRAQRVGARVLLVDKARVQEYSQIGRRAGRPPSTASPIAQFLAGALPVVAADPSPRDCWAWRVLRKDPPQLAALSAAVQVVEQHGQLGALEKRVREEHTNRREHRADDDLRLLDCLTEACAFAWADMRGLGAPKFDHRPGRPDVHMSTDLWVEAKSVHQSQASRAAMAAMLGGGVVSGSVAPPEQNRGMAIVSSLMDARKKFRRLGSGRWVVFFNMPSVDVAQLADQEEVLARYTEWMGQLEAAAPGVSIVFCHAYDWQHPIRDPFTSQGSA